MYKSTFSDEYLRFLAKKGNQFIGLTCHKCGAEINCFGGGAPNMCEKCGACNITGVHDDRPLHETPNQGPSKARIMNSLAGYR